MADLKISQLTDGGASQATDEYVVARSGSNFRIDGASVAAAATSVGTLSSLTVSGNTFLATSSGNVGIGAASATRKLSVAASNAQMELKSANTGYSELYFSDAAGDPGYLSYDHNTDTLSVATGGSARLTLNSSGNLAVDTNTLYVDAANNRVGIGTASPSVRLHVLGSEEIARFVSTSGNTYAGFYHGTSTLFGYVGNGSGLVTGGASGDFAVRSEGALLFSAGGATERARIDTSGNLGLGVTPSAWQSAWKVLETQGGFLGGGGTTYIELGQNIFYDGAFKYKANGLASLYEQSAGLHKWYLAPNNTSGAGAAATLTQAMTLDASGNLGVGTASPTTRLDVAQTNAKSATAVWQIQTFDTTSATTGVGGGISFGGYKTSNTAAEVFAAIDGYKENATGGNAAGALRFHTQVSGGTGVAERARITSGGYFKASNDGTYQDSVGSTHEFNNSANSVTLLSRSTNASFSQYGMRIVATRSATSAYDLATYYSGDFGDTEFQFRGDGNAYADGTFNNNGADYAEYFESATGAALTVGATVVLDGNKVREATENDAPSAILGVIRPKAPGKASMVIGNTAWNKWSNKYLTDDFDCYVMEAHEVVEWTDEDGKLHSYESHNIPVDVVVPQDAVRKTHDDKGNPFEHYKLNPAYDPSVEYVPREKRDEWVIVGLVGQVKVLKGQPVNDRWVKMRDVSAAVEEWMIR